MATPPGNLPAPFDRPSFDAPPALPPPEGWSVAAGRGTAWWSEGWHLFVKAPWMWIGLTVVFVLIMFLLALVPVIGHVATTLLYPVFAAGLLLGARALDRGQPLTFGHLFACFGDRTLPLVIAGLLYLAGWFVIWLVVLALLVAVAGFASLSAILSGDLPLGIDTLMTLGFTAVAALLLGALLGVPLVMAYWFAPALIVFRNEEPLAAMRISFRASLRNVPPFLVYSLVGLVLGILASLPFGLGWLVLAPVFVGSVYASCKDLFGSTVT